MRNSKRMTVLAGGTAALVGVGVAFAAWTSTGTGTGSVTAGSAAVLTVAQVESVGGLYPTGDETIQVKVTNTNPYPIEVSSLVPGAITVDAAHATAGCVAHLVTFGSEPTLTDYLAAGANKTYDLTVSMGANSADECQGATFSSTYTATGASSE